MRNDECWALRIADDNGELVMLYNGDVGIERIFSHARKSFGVTITAEQMDRIAETWQRWRSIDRDDLEPTK